MEIVQGQTKLKMGYTTGSCSAAAAKAAMYMLLTGKRYEYIKIKTPKGIDLNLSVYNQVYQKNFAMCSIIKDAGDDPDAPITASKSSSLISIAIPIFSKRSLKNTFSSSSTFSLKE